MTTVNLDEEAERAMVGKPIAEVIVKAVTGMCDSACQGLLVSLGHPSPYDPKLTFDYNAAILRKAIERIDGKTKTNSADTKDHAGQGAPLSQGIPDTAADFGIR